MTPRDVTRVSSDALDWAIDHTVKYGDTRFFPAPFEYAIIDENRESIIRTIRELPDYACRPYRRALAPKGKGGFRVVTQLDPLQHLLLTALVCEIGDSLEKRRANKEIVWSHRFEGSEDGHMFSTSETWADFDAYCRSKALEPGVHYVLVADIADFFPGIYFHRVEDHLRDIAPGWQTDAILRILGALNTNVSAGLPVGPLASNLIAEASLTELDSHLLGMGFEYCRFSDDFRFFCNTFSHARRCMAELATYLYDQYRLFISAAKTRILTSDEFVAELDQDPASAEMSRLREQLEEMRPGPSFGWYEPFELEELDPDEQSRIADINLLGFLREQLEMVVPDTRTVGWALRQLRRFGSTGSVGLIAENLAVLTVVIDDVIRLLSSLALGKTERDALVDAILDAVERGDVGHTAYELMWIASLLALNLDCSYLRQQTSFWNAHHDQPLVARELLAACTESVHRPLVKARKPDFAGLDPWARRGLIRGSMCLERSERRAWFKGIANTPDPLDRLLLGSL